jgi:hypothetical protein
LNPRPRAHQSGRGRKPSIPAGTVEAIVAATLHGTPPGGTHWSCRSMAQAQGVSPATVQRIWSARGLQPHRVETFKLSNDKRFEQKLIDVVGLYLNRPDKAVVLCMDEKSQIQALDPTQPTVPMKPGRAGTMTHGHKRNGTTTLFAALNVLTGTVIGQCLAKHTNTEFLRFLRRIDREVPEGLAVHLILDNHGTRTHPNVAAWLGKHPRFQLHFTPTSSSWLNVVERWSRNLTGKAIRRGIFRSGQTVVTRTPGGRRRQRHVQSGRHNAGNRCHRMPALSGRCRTMGLTTTVEPGSTTRSTNRRRGGPDGSPAAPHPRDGARWGSARQVQDGVGFLCGPGEQADRFCRWNDHEFDVAIVGRFADLLHHRQRAISTGADHQPAAPPGYAFRDRERGVPVRAAELPGGGLLALADLPAVDDQVVIVGHAVDSHRAE